MKRVCDFYNGIWEQRVAHGFINAKAPKDRHEIDDVNKRATVP